MKTPNGITSWIETHHEIVSFISIEANKNNPIDKIKKVIEESGSGGLWELGEELTNKFEEKYSDMEWDGEFFDKIEEFIKTEL